MSQYAVLQVQNRPAVVAQWSVHPTGNLGVSKSAPRGLGILLKWRTLV